MLKLEWKGRTYDETLIERSPVTVYISLVSSKRELINGLHYDKLDTQELCKWSSPSQFFFCQSVE
jgi:hypothetical protein